MFHNWPPGVDWSDHEFPASLNVADIACGTGTLLMAVAAEAERRHTEAGGRNAPKLHQAMVEQALHGYDVQTLRRAFRRHQSGDAEPLTSSLIA